MATLPTLSLPHTITGTNIDADFIADATVDVVWQALDDKTATGFTWTPFLDETATVTELDGRMWMLRGFDRDGDQWEAGPADAASFKALGPVTSGNSETVIFEWLGVSPSGLDDRFWIRIAAQVEDTTADNEVKWFAWVGREHGWSANLDLVCYPFTVWDSPATKRLADADEMAGEQRTRFFIPKSASVPEQADQMSINDLRTAAEFLDTEVAADNPTSPFASGTVGSTTTPNGYTSKWRETSYPNVYWPLQTAALAICDDTTASEYLRVAQILCQDINYHHKQLWYRGLKTNSGADAALIMAHAAMVPWDRGLSYGKVQDNQFPYSRYGNSYGPKYAVATKVYQALDPSWWYDVCKAYRDWWEANAPADELIRLEDRSELGEFAANPSFHFGTVQTLKPDPTDTTNSFYLTGAWDQSWRTSVSSWTSSLRSSLNSTLFPHKGTVHWQTFDINGIADVWSIGPDGDRYTETVTQNAAVLDDGWRCSFYSNNIRHPEWSNWTGAASGAHWQHGKSGQSNVPVQNVNQDRTEVITSHPPNIVPVATGLEPMYDITKAIHQATAGSLCNAFYLDTFTGDTKVYYRQEEESGPLLARSNATDNAFRKAVKDLVLKRYRAADSGDAQAPLFDAGSTVSAEIVEEGMFGFDWIGYGYNVAPGTGQLADLAVETDYGTGTIVSRLNDADHPAEARHMNPSWWNAVHHERQPCHWLSHTHWATYALATNTRFHSGSGGGSDNAGMTANQFIDAMVFPAFVCLTQGMPSLFATLFAHWPDSLTPADATNDPSDTRATILAAMKTVMESMKKDYGGQFMHFGKMVRPLTQDFTGTNIDTSTNPLQSYEWCKDFKSADLADDRRLPLNPSVYNNIKFGGLGGLTLWKLRWGNNSYAEPDILHSCWQNGAGEFGIVIGNWTRSTAVWRGTINPTIHEGVASSYDIVRLNLGSPTTETSLAAGRTGTTVIGYGGGVGKDVDLGASLAAHSVDVILIREA